MNKLHTHFIQEAANIKLTDSEKMHMRQAITPTPQPVPSPYTSWFRVTSRSMAFALGALVLIVLTGTTAYAAQGTLPGNPLYAVKVDITEPVTGSLALSTEAKAQWNTSIVQTRMQEAEELASQKQLTQPALTELKANLDQHLTQALILTPQVEKENSAAGIQLSAQLAASLGAHGLVLENLGNRQSNTSTQINSQNLAQYALAQSAAVITPELPHPAHAALQAALAVESASSSVSTSTITDVEETALEQLASVQLNFNAVKPSLSATTSKAFQAQIAEASGLLTKKKGASTGSYQIEAQYQEALETGIVLQTFLNADEEFDGSILTPLLQPKPQTTAPAVHKDSDVHSTSGAGVTASSTEATPSDETITLPSAEASSTSSASVQTGSSSSVPTVIQNIIQGEQATTSVTSVSSL